MPLTTMQPSGGGPKNKRRKKSNAARPMGGQTRQNLPGSVNDEPKIKNLPMPNDGSSPGTWGGKAGESAIYGNDGRGFDQEQHSQTMNHFQNNQQAFDSEVQRVNNVVSNRRESGKDTTNQMNYYDQLMNYAPPEQTVSERAREPIQTDQYKIERTTMEDLADQYGFDYSKEAAQHQAEAERQAREDGIEHQRRESDMNVESAGEAMDRNYFQQYQQQQQQQSNAGLNAGIAADQDLRMSMNRQAEMGDIYRDRNLTRAQLDDELGRLEQEALARGDALHFDRLSQGFDQAMQRDELGMQEQQTMLNAALEQRGLDADIDQSDRDRAIQEGELTGSYLSEEARGMLNELIGLKETNESGLTSSSSEFQKNSAEADRIRDQLAMMGVDPSLFGADVSLEDMRSNLNEIGQSTIGQKQLDETERSNRAREDFALKQFNKKYTDLTAWEQHQVDISTAKLDETIRSNKSREDLAWEQHNKQWSGLTPHQQANLDLQWAQQELAYEMFDRPYDQLTTSESAQLDQRYAQMIYNAGADGAFAGGGSSGGGSGNPQAQADQNSGYVPLDY